MPRMLLILLIDAELQLLRFIDMESCRHALILYFAATPPADDTSRYYCFFDS